MRVESFLPLDDWRGVAEVARTSEEIGFDSLMWAEMAHDPFAPLTIAALETSLVTLGTGIAVAFPRSPMVLANTAWDLHAHSERALPPRTP